MNPRGKIRLAVFTDAPELWGAENSLVDLMSRDRDHDFESVIFAPPSSPIHEHPRLRSQTAHLNLPKHPALERGGIRHSSPATLAAEIPAIHRGTAAIRAAAEPFDMLLSFRLWRNQEVITAARRNGMMAAVDLHETFEGRLGRQLSALSLARAGIVICPSKSVALAGGAPLRKTVVVPRAMAFEVNTPHSRTTDRLIVGMFGQLRTHKGHELVMNAVLDAAKTIPVELRIYGSGGSPTIQERIREQASTHGQTVRHFPFTDNPLVAMNECHIVVNASSHEAFGRTIVEGLSVGCLPVVTGNGPAEIVADSGIGMVVDRSQNALKDALVTAWRRPEVLREAGENGPDVVRRLFGLDAVSARYFAALRKSYDEHRERRTA